MKLNNFHRLALTLLCLGLAGCQSHKSVAPVGNGFEEVTHAPRASMDEPLPPRISFQYRGTDGKVTLIWPALFGVNEVVRDNLAIFVGDKAYLDGGSPSIRPRLFAVQPPGLPLDITDEVLWRWSQASGKDFRTALGRFSLVTPEERNGGLGLRLEFDSQDKDWPDKSALQLDWKQVSEIMRAVKTNGVLEKDLRWHTPFIRGKF